MRTLKDHITNPVNDKLEISVMDEPGAGGAHHIYEIAGYTIGNYSSACRIVFQNGPIAEHGVNGVTQEALLAICIDRLRCFQAGPYACQENENALDHLEKALHWLQVRTRDRMQRGVEGTSEK